MPLAVVGARSATRWSILLLILSCNLCASLSSGHPQDTQTKAVQPSGTQAGQPRDSPEVAPRKAGASNSTGAQSEQQLLAIVRSRPRAATLPPKKPASQITTTTIGGQNGGKNQTDLKASSSARDTSSSAPKVQNKRQADGQSESTGQPASGRNSDAWFLDQAPLPLQPYRFVYDVKGPNGLTEQYRQEVGDGKYLTGSYGYVLPDGIYRHVDYIADERGFRAFIRTSEPGTANQNPADVVINSTPSGVYSPPVSYGRDLGAPSSANNISLVDLSRPSAFDQVNEFNLAREQILSNNNFRQTLLQREQEQRQRLFPARRPPGSIVNTPLAPLPPSRNFTSFAYQPNQIGPLGGLAAGEQEPSLDLARRGLSSVSWPLGAGKASPSASSTDSNEGLQRGFGSGELGAGKSNNNNNNNINNNFNSYSGSQNWPGEQQPPAAPQRLELERARQLPEGQLSGRQLGGWPGSGSPSPVGRTFLASARLGPGSPTRNGPDVLAYDRQFSEQAHFNGKFLPYDYDHALYPQSQQLALDRARSIAQLEHLNSLKRLNGQTVQTSSSADPLAPLAYASLLPLTPKGAPQSGNTPSSSSSSSSYRSEHHQQQQEHHSMRQFVDTLNKVSLTKEHRSGSSFGFGREQHASTSQPSLGQLGGTKGGTPQQSAASQREPDSGASGGPSGSLPPPPEPQFSARPAPHHFRPASDQSGSSVFASDAAQLAEGAVKGGGGQAQLGRLKAPYAHHQQHLAGASQEFGESGERAELANGQAEQQQQAQSSKTAKQDQAGGERHAHPASPQEPARPREPDTPREPQEPRVPMGAGGAPSGPMGDQQQPSATTSSTKSAGATQAPPASSSAAEKGDSGAEPAGTKGASKSSRQQAVFRSIRMPEDYRSSMQMNDLRSMQNSIGLPQPPRMDNLNHLDASFPSNIADHFLTSRLARIDALVPSLARPVGPIPVSVSGGALLAGQAGQQQASNRDSVAVLARDLVQQQMSKSRQKAKLASLKQTSEAKLAQVGARLQPQQQLVGPLSSLDERDQSLNSIPLTSIEQAFEAQRLVSSEQNRTRGLRADKVSELEKFQRRLKSQQLLLEQLKSNEPSAGLPIAHNVSQSGAPSSHLQRPQTLSGGKQKVLHSTGGSMETPNSHVKYDEPAESEQQRPKGAKSNTSGEVARTRRENEESQPETASGQLVAGGSNNSTRRQVEDFVSQLQKWPSLSGPNSSLASSNGSLARLGEGLGVAPLNVPNGGHEKDKARELSHSFVEQPVGKSEGRPKLPLDQSSQHNSSTISTTTTSTTSRPKLPNTINLDFINSVTALSVDQLNPFAISSVNPAISGPLASGQLGHNSAAGGHQMMHHFGQANNLDRLTPHRLSLDTRSQPDQRHQQGFQLIQAAHESADLSAVSLDKRQSTVGEAANGGPLGNRSLASVVPANHQPSSGHRAQPSSALELDSRYMSLSSVANLFDHSPRGSHASLESPIYRNQGDDYPNHRNSLGASFIVGPSHSLPATTNLGSLFEAASSNDPRRSPKIVSRRQTGDEPKSTRQTASVQRQPVRLGEVKPEPQHPIRAKTLLFKQSQLKDRTTTSRDGFEVKDRAVQADGGKFFEVVSSSPARFTTNGHLMLTNLDHEDKYDAFRGR